jgi:hypothetical protein
MAVAAAWLILAGAGVEKQADLPMACLAALLPLLAPVLPALTPAQEPELRAAMADSL